VQKVRQKTDTCTEVQSLTLVKNILRSSIASIAYLRYLFPEDNFTETQLAGLKIKSLRPKQNPEITAMTEWMEQGVFDAIEKHYLRALVFSVFGEENDTSSLLESYTFKFSYPEDGHLAMDFVAQAKGQDPKEMTYMTREQIQQAWCTMIRSLITLSHTLPPLPSQRHIAMRLFYYDEVTPDDYEPPGFSKASDIRDFEFVTDIETVEVGGSIKTKHHAVSLRLDTAMINLTRAQPEVPPELKPIIKAISKVEFVTKTMIAELIGETVDSKMVSEVVGQLCELGIVSENKGANGRFVIRNEENEQIFADACASDDEFPPK
jgi:hypothetical protein